MIYLLENCAIMCNICAIIDCIDILKMLTELNFFSDKEAVEKRLYVLQQQGYIYATDSS